jgi:hypothetical protein
MPSWISEGWTELAWRGQVDRTAVRLLGVVGRVSVSTDSRGAARGWLPATPGGQTAVVDEQCLDRAGRCGGQVR